MIGRAFIAGVITTFSDRATMARAQAEAIDGPLDASTTEVERRKSRSPASARLRCKAMHALRPAATRARPHVLPSRPVICWNYLPEWYAAANIP